LFVGLVFDLCFGVLLQVEVVRMPARRQWCGLNDNNIYPFHFGVTAMRVLSTPEGSALVYRMSQSHVPYGDCDTQTFSGNRTWHQRRNYFCAADAEGVFWALSDVQIMTNVKGDCWVQVMRDYYDQ